MKESKFQIKVYNWLTKHGYYAFSVPNGLHVEDVRNIAVNKMMGMRNGVSDLIVLRPNGRCIFLELKNETGKQRKEQSAFEVAVEAMGFEYKVIRPVKNPEYWKELHQWLK